MQLQATSRACPNGNFLDAKFLDPAAGESSDNLALHARTAKTLTLTLAERGALATKVIAVGDLTAAGTPASLEKRPQN
jgi:hypothetical protein